jgi:hypothetical protein
LDLHGLSEEMTLRLNSENEKVEPSETLGKKFFQGGEGSSRYKGPEVNKNLALSLKKGHLWMAGAP